jgi:N-methylhydantoinase A
VPVVGAEDAVTGAQIGVDVGGTFTDLLSLDPASNSFRVAKVPSTPDNQARGVLDGVRALGAQLGTLDAVVHGTTVGTNAILERKGARCGLVTTKGFRDVLELGRRTRPFGYGMIGSFEALVPRDLRFEVSERVDAKGRVIAPLDEAEVRAVVRRLKAAGVEAVIVHFLHSYINPAHERRCAALIREEWSDAHLTVGHEILREVREFERGSTAALNGYIQPIMTRYLGRLSNELKVGGFRRDLLVMQGNGGTMTAGVAGDMAVHTVMSGPAAGALAVARIATAAGFPNVIGCDMGGTSFDVSVVRGGEPALSAEKDLAYGVPIRVPIIDIHTIGAGGGSIARLNKAGILQVGPESAGARPGPICYGRGGTQPTVTDANLVLGRLDANAIVSVDKAVGVEAVKAALVEQIGKPLGLDAVGAAAAIVAVAANHLAGAIRMVSIEKGYDPRDFALFPFGGAGPLHAVQLARELGVPTVLVPRFPGITSALGCVLAHVRHDFVRTLNQPLAEISGAEIDAMFAEQATRGRNLIAEEGVPVDGVEVTHEADFFYRGQSHVIRVPVDSPGFDVGRAATRLAERYKARFAIELGEMRAMLANLRTTVIGRRPDVDLSLFAPRDGDMAAARIGERAVYFDGGWHKTPIYQREKLPAGATLAGPAIVQQLDSTTVLDPGATAKVDALSNLVIAVGGKP